MSEIAEHRRTDWARTTPKVSELVVSLTACLLTVASVGLVLVATPVATGSIAVPVFVIGAGILFGLGLSDLARVHETRFARALLVAGVLWSLSALTASTQPTLHSIGRVSLWFAPVALPYVLLAYPSGRLQTPADRALILTGALIVACLYLPTALLVAQFPNPAPWSTCTLACPHNVFAVGHTSLSLVVHVIAPLREALTVAVFVAIAGVLTNRVRSSRALLRRMYMPIAGMAIVQAIVWAGVFVTRRVAPSSEGLQIALWCYVFLLPLVGLACMAARLSRRVHAANALDRISRLVRTSASAAELTEAMADALEDPALQIVHSVPEEPAWVDESGSPVALAQLKAGQEVTQVDSASWRMSIIHSPAFTEDRALIQTAGSMVLAALENHHLNRELRSSLQQLADASARQLAAEQSERRKIERDLHDGAQQRLVAVRLKLGLAAELLAGQDPARAEVIRALGAEIDDTIDEVRSLARGIYPPLLAQTGLRQALGAVARSAALPTTVHAVQLGRYRPEIESTVYFSCSEALQNAAKHARRATRVTITVWQEGELKFEVCDDGAGFDVQQTPFGTGLGNLRGRLAAVGGTMTIRSVPGQGTVLSGSIPLVSAVLVTEGEPAAP